jgi:L-lactate utilization protein LutC
MRKTSGLFAARVAERPPSPAELAETVRRELAERWPETLERFRLELERVGGVFHRAPSLEAVPALIGAIARERSARTMVTWHPTALGGNLGGPLAREGLEVRAMPWGPVEERERQALRAAAATADLGLTGVDLAVAETGSLVLRSGPGRPRSTSLLPPCHVAMFDRGRLVESLAQAGIVLEAWHEGPSPYGATVSFITGPSRTADIELTLTRGVHGPKEVHAVFVDEALDA